MAVLDNFESIVHAVDASVFVSMREEALVRIASRDADDWPIFAAALALGLPIWTADQDSSAPGCPPGPPTGSMYLDAAAIDWGIRTPQNAARGKAVRRLLDDCR